MKQVADTKGWPGMNPGAFWSLTERVNDIFSLEKTDEFSAIYVFTNTENGNILAAPFQALYNIYVDWPGKEVCATLFFNNVALETCTTNEEIQFDVFCEEDPLPICLMKPTDELRLVIAFKERTFLPTTIGSARMLKFTPRERIDPFCICTTETCVLMYTDNHIEAVSSLNTTENEYTEVVEAILNSQMAHDEMNDLLRSMENPLELQKLRNVLHQV